MYLGAINTIVSVFDLVDEDGFVNIFWEPRYVPYLVLKLSVEVWINGSIMDFGIPVSVGCKVCGRASIPLACAHRSSIQVREAMSDGTWELVPIW